MIEWPRPRDINARLSINKRLTRSALATFHAPISLSTVNLPSERTSKQARKRKAPAAVRDRSLRKKEFVFHATSARTRLPVRGLVNEAWTLMSLSPERAASERCSKFSFAPFLPPPSIIRTVRGRTEGRGSGWSGGRKGEGIRH